MADVAVLRQSGRVFFANRGLRRVASTWGLWIAGEWAFLVLLSATAFDRGGTGAVAAVGVVRMIPGAVVAPLVAIAIDRVSRVRLLVGVLLSWALFAAFVPVVLHPRSLLPLYLLVGAASISGALLRPAVSALIPQVVDRPEELAVANSVYSLLEAAGSLGGPLLAGLLLASTDPTTAYLVTAAVFGAAALLTTSIRTDFQPPERLPDAGWRRMIEPLAGFPELVRGRRLRVVVLVFIAQTATRGLLNVLVVAAAVSLFHSGLSSTGPLFAAIGAGGLVGAVATASLPKLPPALPFVLGMVLWGAPLLAIAAHPSLLVAWIALAVIGIGNTLGDVFGLTLLHRLIPDHLLGRTFGAFWGAVSAAIALGSLAAPVLIHHLGLRGAILAAGSAMTTIALASWFSVRRIGADLAVDGHDVDVLRRCTLLAPLTQVAIEQLARRARRITVAGHVNVVEQGQLGDTFYVVDSGELEASVEGKQVRLLRPGDCFGEIAALNHTPRTATVTTRAATELLAVRGLDFVLAVTGYGAAERAARSLAGERLAAGRPDRAR